MGSVTHVEYEKKELVRDVHKLVWLGVQLEDSPKGGFMVHNIFVSFLVVDVMSKQHLLVNRLLYIAFNNFVSCIIRRYISSLRN